MMDDTKNRQSHRIWFLALAVMVCAWLLPTSAGIASTSASTASGKMRVSLTVEDTAGVDFGRSAAYSMTGNNVITVIHSYFTDTDHQLRGAKEGSAPAAGKVTNTEVIITVSEL